MNALAIDQLYRLRSMLAGSGISFGMYIGTTAADQNALRYVHRMQPNEGKKDTYIRTFSLRDDISKMVKNDDLKGFKILKIHTGSSPEVLFNNCGESGIQKMKFQNPLIFR